MPSNGVYTEMRFYLPRGLIRRIDRIARERNMSRDDLIMAILDHDINDQGSIDAALARDFRNSARQRMPE